MPRPAQFIDLHFPLGGVDTSAPFDRQPNVPVGDSYARTTPSARNVRAYDPLTDRARGGRRPANAKWCPTVLAGSVQDLSLITIPDTSVEGMQPASRTVKMLAVAAGRLYSVTSSGVTSIDASFLSATAPVVYATPSNLKLYYTDGLTPKVYDAVAGTTAAWTASAGSFPTGGGKYPRLLCTWRGRVCQSGLRSDPQNVFLSAVDNARDYNYSPTSITPTQAIALNSAPCGTVGDIVTCLIPWSDDVLMVGGDHSIYQLSGDPMAGGQLDRLSNMTGMAWGRPYCTGPDDTIYFFGSRGGVWAIVPGAKPVRISQQVTDELADVDVGDSIIRMAWDDRAQGFHLFISPLTATTAAQHWFWEARANAWFPFDFANVQHNPLAVATFDGDDPADRAVLFGGRDGYVRQFDSSKEKDDGQTPIPWHVVIGPLLTPDMDELLLKDLQGIMAATSGEVTWEVLAARTAEEALDADADWSGTWTAGRNPSALVRAAGHALYVRLSGTARAAFEAVRANVAGLGKVRRRA